MNFTILLSILSIQMVLTVQMTNALGLSERIRIQGPQLSRDGSKALIGTDAGTFLFRCDLLEITKLNSTRFSGASFVDDGFTAVYFIQEHPDKPGGSIVVESIATPKVVLDSYKVDRSARFISMKMESKRAYYVETQYFGDLEGSRLIGHEEVLVFHDLSADSEETKPIPRNVVIKDMKVGGESDAILLVGYDLHLHRVRLFSIGKGDQTPNELQWTASAFPEDREFTGDALSRYVCVDDSARFFYEAEIKNRKSLTISRFGIDGNKQEITTFNIEGLASSGYGAISGLAVSEKNKQCLIVLGSPGSSEETSDSKLVRLDLEKLTVSEIRLLGTR